VEALRKVRRLAPEGGNFCPVIGDFGKEGKSWGFMV